MQEVKSKSKSSAWIIKNNGEIVYPYSEAERKEVKRREFRNSLDELIAKGFLDITHQGTGGRSGDMTKYFLDDRWKNYGTSAFLSAKKPRKKDTRKGRGYAAYHAKKKTSVTKLIPKKGVSSSKFDTPDGKTRILSSDIFDTPKEGNNSVTANNI